MKKFTIISITILYICLGISIYIIYPKLNYLSYIVKNEKEKQERDFIKSEQLQKELDLYVKNMNYKKDITLNLYKDYFIINGDFCDIKDEFFLSIEEDLKRENIIYKPKIAFDEKNNSQINITNYGKKINGENLKYKICSFVKSQKQIDNIEIEIQNYNYNNNELNDLKSYKEVGKYEIKTYYKTPIESIKNSQLVINSISNELIYPGENISVLENLLKHTSELEKSNILKDGEIIKGIGGGSCLASSIIYRTLLNTGINIKSQKTHNIYYENIYGPGEIGLDSTIYEDEKYFVDLLFENNYSSPIILIPEFSNSKIALKVYAKNKDFSSKLTPINTTDISNISWKYEIFDKNNNLIKEEEIISKYDKIDSF